MRDVRSRGKADATPMTDPSKSTSPTMANVFTMHLR